MFLKVTQYYVAELGFKPAPLWCTEGRARAASAQRGSAGLGGVIQAFENP